VQEDPWIVEQRRLQGEQRKQNKEFADSLLALEPDERAAVQGHAPGAYVRVLLTQVPCELPANFEVRIIYISG